MKKNHFKNILSTGLWLQNSYSKKNNYFTKILFDEIQIIIADFKNKKIEDVLPRVFMPTFSLIFVLLIFFSIANNFLNFNLIL